MEGGGTRERERGKEREGREREGGTEGEREIGREGAYLDPSLTMKCFVGSVADRR